MSVSSSDIDISQVTGQDLEYSCSRWTHRKLNCNEVVLEHLSVLSEGSKRAKNELHVVADVQYGSSPKTKLDIYSKTAKVPPGSPLVAYIHGGYWNALSKEDSAFIAPFVCTEEVNAVFVAVGYVLARENVGDGRASMQNRCFDMKDALLALVRISEELKCSGIHLCGHSAGGHLVAMMISQEYGRDATRIFSRIKSAWICSGIFDLEPISRTYVNDPMQLTRQEITNCSPINCTRTLLHNWLHTGGAKIYILYGQYDPPAFKEQARRYFEQVTADAGDLGCQANFVEPPEEIPNRDHFDLISLLDAEENEIIKRLCHVLKSQRTTAGIAGVPVDLQELDLKTVVEDIRERLNS